MREITEREIVEAATAMQTKIGAYRYWDNVPIDYKFYWLTLAYAALRAARKVRG